MSVQNVESFVAGQWVGPNSQARPIYCAITGTLIAQAGNSALNFESMHAYARQVGGPNLRAMTFHQRAKMLKSLALYLDQHKQALYDISFTTGATQKDHKLDIDGGIGTVLVFASKGRREMPDAQIYLDGHVEQLSKQGTFVGQHVCTPRHGVALHINAFNFPIWGMLEKLAPTLLAGMPAIVKPATATCYVTELCIRFMLESGLLPQGALQLVSGSIGPFLDLLDGQDVVSFTGSAETTFKLRSSPNILASSTRFIAEQDSLNASILGPDALPRTPEFDLFIQEVTQEITSKAGQKCTAIRRIMAPYASMDALIMHLKQSLSEVRIGDPRLDTTDMGALVSQDQKSDVLAKASLLASEAECLWGDPNTFELEGADTSKGAFVPPMLFHCPDPLKATLVHEIEAFGPVTTLMAYEDLDQAIALVNRGQGGLVTSLFSHDPEVVQHLTMGIAAFHGRIYINNRDSMDEATGHGSPLPHMLHGGPGRAGGGEELGGVRGLMPYMQRTAIQASPAMLARITQKWVPGAPKITHEDHPFTRTYLQLDIGETFQTSSRQISLADIEHFAQFTGDTFYAHMDEDAAKRNPFFPGRVAHGYLLLSFAAGLFVQPDEGPVLANTGLDQLRFMKPVEAGESIHVHLSVKQKTPRNSQYGEVRWHVSLLNQDEDLVADYELLTMNAYHKA